MTDIGSLVRQKIGYEQMPAVTTQGHRHRFSQHLFAALHPVIHKVHFGHCMLKLITDIQFATGCIYKRCTSPLSHTYHGFGKVPAGQRHKIDFIFVGPGIQVSQTGILPESPTRTGHVSDHNPHWGIIRLP